MIIYICGPMRGIRRWNTKAFDEADYQLSKRGHEVINPAQLDRLEGFDAYDLPADTDWTQFPDGLNFEKTVKRDLDAVRSADAIFLLEGWQDSVGANAELAVAKWCGLEVYEQGVTGYDVIGFAGDGPLCKPNDGPATIEMTAYWQDLQRRIYDMYKLNTQDLLNYDVVDDFGIFPTDAQERKTYPVFTGLLNYFPHACAAVAHHSFVGNEQHNAGEPMHWAKEKSVGTGDQVVRHIMEGWKEFNLDKDATESFCAQAWRAFELLERYLTRLPPFDKA